MRENQPHITNSLFKHVKVLILETIITDNPVYFLQTFTSKSIDTSLNITKRLFVTALQKKQKHKSRAEHKLYVQEVKPVLTDAAQQLSQAFVFHPCFLLQLGESELLRFGWSQEHVLRHVCFCLITRRTHKHHPVQEQRVQEQRVQESVLAVLSDRK